MQTNINESSLWHSILLLFVYGNESRVHLAAGCDSGERRCVFGWFVCSQEPAPM